MNAIINTPNQVKEVAHKLVAQQEAINASKKFEFEQFANTLSNLDPNLGGFDELGAMLALPDESFALIAPVFLNELEQGLNNVNDKLLMVQSMNLAGLTVEQMQEQYLTICEGVDAQLKDSLSDVNMGGGMPLLFR